MFSTTKRLLKVSNFIKMHQKPPSPSFMFPKKTAKPRNSWLANTCGVSLAELMGKPISEVLSQRSKKPLKDTPGFFPGSTGAKRMAVLKNSRFRDGCFGGSWVAFFWRIWRSSFVWRKVASIEKNSSWCYFVILQEVYHESSLKYSHVIFFVIGESFLFMSFSSQTLQAWRNHKNIWEEESTFVCAGASWWFWSSSIKSDPNKINGVILVQKHSKTGFFARILCVFTRYFTSVPSHSIGRCVPWTSQDAVSRALSQNDNSSETFENLVLRNTGKQPKISVGSKGNAFWLAG